MLGSGTALDPYQVATASDLNDVRNDLGAYYIQMNDIDLSGYANWEPIAYSADKDIDPIFFHGTYDGNNFKITGLQINQPTYDNGVGLFSCVDGTAEFKNITLENVFIENAIYCGALLGWSEYSKYTQGGWVNPKNTNITVTNCHSSGTISGTEGLGGLLGPIGGISVNISECSSSCDITSSEENYLYYLNLGGLISMISTDGSSEQIVSKCFATGDVISNCENSLACGGLIGAVYGYDEGYNFTVQNSYARGNVTATGLSGGLIGECMLADIINCYSTGLVSFYEGGTEDEYYILGGLIGTTEDGVYEVSVSSSYYDYETSVQADNIGLGTPKTTAEMKTLGTFIDWDFISIWILDSGNDGYPHFFGGGSLANFEVYDWHQSAMTQCSMVGINIP